MHVGACPAHDAASLTAARGVGGQEPIPGSLPALVCPTLTFFSLPLFPSYFQKQPYTAMSTGEFLATCAKEQRHTALCYEVLGPAAELSPRTTDSRSSLVQSPTRSPTRPSRSRRRARLSSTSSSRRCAGASCRALHESGRLTSLAVFSCRLRPRALLLLGPSGLRHDRLERSLRSVRDSAPDSPEGLAPLPVRSGLASSVIASRVSTHPNRPRLCSAYSSEVGESFRPIVPPWIVTATVRMRMSLMDRTRIALTNSSCRLQYGVSWACESCSIFRAPVLSLTLSFSSYSAARPGWRRRI
jgi:hypothetical protein